MRRRQPGPVVSDLGRVLGQSHRLRRPAGPARQKPASFSPVLLFPGVRRPGPADYRLGSGPAAGPARLFSSSVRKRREERLRRAEKNPVAVSVRKRRERRARLGEETWQAAFGGGEV